MGEIADMMLDGTLCQHCGAYVGSDNGFPTSCGCENEEDDLPNFCCECDHFPLGKQGFHCGLKNKKVRRTTVACEKFK